ncbi:hypothetical protein COO60DRAFT_1643785 [Scenedesmus sp. NREL 46B-D3]|nr:hypothetical protein COO60DRAFT_1643785 [Scenedesmus sp. NREL 46B-D3]
MGITLIIANELLNRCPPRVEYKYLPRDLDMYLRELGQATVPYKAMEAVMRTNLTLVGNVVVASISTVGTVQASEISATGSMTSNDVHANDDAYVRDKLAIGVTMGELGQGAAPERLYIANGNVLLTNGNIQLLVGNINLENGNVFGASYSDLKDRPRTADDLPGGATNYYFTAERARASLSAGAGLVFANGQFSASAASTTAAGIVQLSDSTTDSSTTVAATANAVRAAFNNRPPTTDALAEGTVNLYYSNARVRSTLSAGTGLVYANGQFSVSAASTTAAGIVRLSDSTSDSSTANAATANAVRAAFNNRPASTDALAEGTVNQYFSNTRVRSTLSAGTGLTYANGVFSALLSDSTSDSSTASAATANAVRAAFNNRPASTDALAEGTVNLYYSNTRVRSTLSAGTGLVYANGQFSASAASTTATGIVRLSDSTSDSSTANAATANAVRAAFNNRPASTDALAEGTVNQYFSNARVRSTLSAGTGLTYANGVFSALLSDSTTDSSTAVAATANAVRAAFNNRPASTDALAEGTVNLYYSNARVRSTLAAGTGLAYANGVFSAQLSDSTTDSSTAMAATANAVRAAFNNRPASTDALAEGIANLYYSNTRVRSTLSAGAGLVFANGQFSASAASTTAAGIVQLSDSTSDSLTTVAATANAVRAAFNNRPASTDALAEGIANLYYSNTRVRSTLSAGAGLVYANGQFSASAASTTTAGIVQLSDSTTDSLTTVAATANAVRAAFNNRPASTDALAEGTVNQYFSNTRVRSTLWAGAGLVFANGQFSANVASTTAAGIVQLSDSTTNSLTTVAATANAVRAAFNNRPASTDALAEGTVNQYFSNARVRSTLSAGAGLVFANGQFSANVASTTAAGIVQLSDSTTDSSTTNAATANAVRAAFNNRPASTDALAEGTVNIYYSNARVRSTLSAGAGLVFANGQFSGSAASTTAAGIVQLSDSTNDSSTTAAATANAVRAAFNNRPATADALTEGTTNLYYSNARVRSTLSAGAGLTFTNGVFSAQLSDSTSNSSTSVAATANAVRAAFNNRPATADALAEGTTNLYYSNARVRSTLSAGTGLTFTNGVFVASAASTTAAGIVQLSDSTSDNSTANAATANAVRAAFNNRPATADALAEGTTNLYYSNARVRSTLSAGAGLTFTNGVFVASAASTTAAGIVQLSDSTTESSTSVAATANAVRAAFNNRPATADALTEGSTNLYYSNARVHSTLSAGAGLTYTNGVFSAQLSDSTSNSSTSVAATANAVRAAFNNRPASTDALAEGTVNLYYSNARVRSTLSAGAGLSFTNGQFSGSAASTTAAGIVQLSDSTSDSSTANAATANAVRAAFNNRPASTDALAEGTVNQYFSNARVRSTLSAGAGLVFANGQFSGSAASTTAAGIVQLSDATSNSSTSVAATANAVKTVYDLVMSGGGGGSSSSNTISNVLLFGATGLSTPAVNSSAGERIRLQAGNAATVPYGFGLDTATLWGSVPGGARYRWYTGTQTTMQHENGNLMVTGDIVSSGSLSDARLKQDVSPIELGAAMRIVQGLRPVEFTWKHDIPSTSRQGLRDHGFIAQEVTASYPYVTDAVPLLDGNLYHIIRYEKFAPLLCACIKHLDQQVTELRALVQSK